jgi:hypothetical protein
MQRIRDCWWAAEKPSENPSRPNGARPGFRNTTSSVIKVSKRTRSPALTASIQVVCTSRIARSPDPIRNLHCQTSLITRRFGRRPSKSIGLDLAQVLFARLSADDTAMNGPKADFCDRLVMAEMVWTPQRWQSLQDRTRTFVMYRRRNEIGRSNWRARRERSTPSTALNRG